MKQFPSVFGRIVLKFDQTITGAYVAVSAVAAPTVVKGYRRRLILPPDNFTVVN